MSFAATDGAFDDSYAGCGNVLFDMIKNGDVVKI